MGIEIAVKKSFESYELDFQVKSDAKWIAILGASGSGKSLTLKSIAGVETPDSGSIVVGGRVLFDSVTKVNLPSRERKVGYLFQNYALFPTMTVEENIGVGIKNKKNQKKIETLKLTLDDLLTLILEVATTVVNDGEKTEGETQTPATT